MRVQNSHYFYEKSIDTFLTLFKNKVSLYPQNTGVNMSVNLNKKSPKPCKIKASGTQGMRESNSILAIHKC